MKREFVVERQGRSFVLFAGLLDLAHSMGLIGIETTLIQIPDESNGRTAIVSAVATFNREGVERRFSGLADANPGNVAPAMANCIIRMAETRSIARALRVGTNVAVTAFEELGEGGIGDDLERSQGRPQRVPQRTAAATAAVPREGACEHCPTTDARKGNHHKPGCPNRTEQKASAAA